MNIDEIIEKIDMEGFFLQNGTYGLELRDTLKAELATLRSRLDSAMEAFEKYGQHFSNCDIRQPTGTADTNSCTCGFSAALASQPADEQAQGDNKEK